MRRLATRSLLAAFLAAPFAVGSAAAAPVYWTDWTGSDLDPGTGFQGQGTITTPSSSLTVTYTNAAGISFYQSGGGTDFWVPQSPGGTSPFVSAAVDNRPTGTDIVALQFQGTQTLDFSVAIANPVFAFVSLNGNGYEFLNQDFDILSTACGYWGCGSVTKEVEDIGGGNTLYKLIGSGEPHGTIQFKGAFDTLTWTSLSNENWNGFTVGVQGTAAEVFDTPEPASLTLFGAAVLALRALRRRRAVG